MPLRPIRRLAQDRTVIHVDDDVEVRYWTNKLGVDDATLKFAVHSAGHDPDNVRQFLLTGILRERADPAPAQRNSPA